MAKYKSLIVTTLLSMAALTGAVTTGVVRNRSMASSFEGDGYIVNVAETEEGLTAEPVYFSAGTRYKKTYPDEVVFKDIRGTKYTVDQDSLVHYQDGSMSAMTSGVVLNLDDVNGGLVNTYSFDAGTVLASNGSGYTAENNGTSIPFDNFVWKLSDDRYYVYSDNLQVETVNGTMEDMSGGVQVDYVEDGIIRLSSENAAWQGIAAGGKVVTGDGATLSFDDKVITDASGNARMTLGEILMDADDNIKVQSAQDWVPPEFDFTVIDGEDGQVGVDGVAGQEGTNGENGEAGPAGEAGEDGVDGEEGAAGDDGDDGSDGSSGQNGSAGSNGKLGGDGANGSIPQNQATEQATISLTSFDVDAGKVSGSIRITDEDGVLEADTGSIKVIDTSTGQSMTALIDDITEAENMTFAADDEYNFSLKNLNADTQYRLVVTSGYSLSENSGSTSGGKKDFINRTFYTDSTGIILELERASTTGFVYTIDKKDYATIQTAQIIVKDENGAQVYNRSISLSSGRNEYSFNMLDLTSSSDPSDSGVATQSGDRLTEADLADHVFTITMKLTGAGVDKEVTQKWRTLKQKPKIGIPVVSVNSGGYFEINQPIISDPNNALTGYTYQVYQSGEVIKSIDSKSTSNVAIYLDDKIQRKQSYTLKTIATYYDNEKSQQITSYFSASFRMDDQGDALVYFVHADETDDVVNGTLVPTGDVYNRQASIWGTVVIRPQNLDVTISQDAPLTVTLESSGNYRRTWTITDSNFYKHETNSIQVPIHANGLKADTSYRIFVTGYVNNNTGTTDSHETMVYLGDYAVSTAAYSSNVKISLTRVAGDINAAFTARMEMTTEDGQPTVETGVLDQLEFRLYQGSSADGIYRGSYTLTDTNRLHNQSQISDDYLNKTNAEDQLVITNAMFNLSNSSLTASSYYLEVYAAYDYTASFYDSNGGTEDGTGKNLSKFKNELPYSLGGVVLPISNALPSLPQPNNEAITTTALTAGDLRGNTAYNSIQDQLADMDDTTVVGYRLQARLNNDNGYARAIRYFGFKTSELDQFDKQTAGVTNPIDWDSGSHYDFAYPLQVEENAASMPGLQVLFLTAPDGSGSSYPGLNADDIKFVKGVDTAGDGGNAREVSMDGYQTVFTGNAANGLRRGYHYTFGFKVRMQVENTEILYPDEYKQEIVSGTGMLSSPSLTARRQDTTVQMYLKETLGTGSGDDPYRTVWNLKVLKDVDGAWDQEYSGPDSDSSKDSYVKGLRILSTDGITYNPERSELLSDGSYNVTVPVRNGSTRYTFKMYQKYYEEDTDTDKSTASGQTLAIQEYAAPTTLKLVNVGDTISSEERNSAVTVEATFPDASNEVTFTLSSSNTALLSRIQALKIQILEATTGRVAGRWSNVRMQNMDGNSRTATVDLTSIRDSNGNNLSGTFKFNVQAAYADGKYGMPENFDPDKEYAAKILDSEAFMNSCYTEQNGIVRKYESMGLTYLTNGGYAVTKKSPVEEEADWSLQLKNKHDNYSTDLENYFYDMNLYVGKAGAEWFEKKDAVVEGNGNKIVFCEIQQPTEADTLHLNHINGAHETITIGTLKPSISWVNTSTGIDTATFNLSTSSYSLIGAPTAGTKLGKDNKGEDVIADGTQKYIWLRVYKLEDGQSADNTPIAELGAAVWERAIPIYENRYNYYIDADNMPDQYMQDGTLSSDARYMLVCETWGLDAKEPEIMLGQKTSSGLAKYTFRTISSIDITDGKTSAISYDSYQNKTVTVEYKLARISGFNLKYELRKYRLGEADQLINETGNPTIMQTYTHDQVMENLLGYTLDAATGTWKKGALTWSLRGEMSETFNLSPAADRIMEPGFDYVLVVDARNANDETVATKPLYIPISWPALRKPTGTVSFRITGSSSNQTLWADVSLSDPNRMVVSDGNTEATYVIASRKAGSQDKWKYQESYRINYSTAVSIASQAEELQESWEVGIFAVTDPSNKGDKEALTKERFEAMTEKKQNECLITKSTKQGLEAWGGSLGDESITLDGGNVTLSLAKSYGLEKIARIDYSLIPWSGGGTGTSAGETQISGTLSRGNKTSLFTTYNSGYASQYDLLTIPTGLKREQKLWLITIQLFLDGSEIPVQTYSTSIPY